MSWRHGVGILAIPLAYAITPGCGGASLGITCDEWISFVEGCVDGYCADEGAGTRLCGCWDKGMDLDISSCQCVPLDLSPSCNPNDLAYVDRSTLSCALVEGRLQSPCEGSCTGTPAPCEARSKLTCEPTTSAPLGCALQESCTGTPQPCADQPLPLSCTNQKGCQWDDATQTCSGQVVACEAPEVTDCYMQAGCEPALDPPCAGTPVACAQLDPVTCGQQPGCTFQ